MESIFDIVKLLKTKKITRSRARDIIAGWSEDSLARHLQGLGLSLASIPSNPSVVADILLALASDQPATKRLKGPRKLDKLVSGSLYRSDPPSLRGRFAYRRDDTLRILALHFGEDSPPTLVEEFALSSGELPDDLFLQAPDWNGVPISDPPPEPIASGARGEQTHFRVDIKLVYWIPYRRNTFPIPQRFLPDQWRDATMPPEVDLATRAMLGTGNPTPPDTFPTKADWDKFVESKEYRGLLYDEFFACCPSEQPGVSDLRYLDNGYTPPESDTSPNPAATFAERLHEDRKDKQNAGSLVENMVLGDAGEYVLPIPLPVHDQWEDALKLIKERARRSKESYSQGEARYSKRDVPECLQRVWRFSVRVGRVHNLLNFAATRKLVKFQGSELMVKACCKTQKLNFFIWHSAIPSMRIYINNRMAWEYDMLTASWPEVESCFYPASSSTFSGSEAELRDALTNPPHSFMNKTGGGNDLPLTMFPGCPSKTPQSWLFV